ncbi:hypothetical protein LEWO105114_11450 [Legionella worsleiensis]|uniref:Uncharacterized protein n=1 Tax=Legionella worsleiensis TaxID=45076 RepID=A0A0W1A3I8_9GAMM|nr:hypothetical protein Lwor_2475 [Legionella worsleiensis]STY32922.1 Uncharacterised protein [Legionella worsleiensis]
MKLKVLLLGALFCLIHLTPSHAKRYNYHLPRTPKYGSSYGRTHSVRPYFKKNGTFVQRHRSSNPRSGIHCHNNVCY